MFSKRMQFLAVAGFILASAGLQASEAEIKVTITETHTYAPIDLPKPPQLYALVPIKPGKRWSNTTTALVGALVGASTGVAARLTDGLFPFNWIGTMILRRSLLNAIENDAEHKNEYLDRSFAGHTAWASDWIAYLALGSMR